MLRSNVAFSNAVVCTAEPYPRNANVLTARIAEMISNEGSESNTARGRSSANYLILAAGKSVCGPFRSTKRTAVFFGLRPVSN